MTKTEDALAAGRAMRGTANIAFRADPKKFFENTKPTELAPLLLGLARSQLSRWIDESADYTLVRSRLIEEYAQITARQHPTHKIDPQEYVTRQQGVYLALYNSRYESTPLPLEKRREVIRDTLARWLWLYKRNEYFGGNDQSLATVNPADCDKAAQDAIDVEAQRRRK
jgi:hypothetical protein